MLVLAGASLIWGSLTGVVLVPVLAGLLQRRFILGEEAMLRRFYGAEYETYAQAVRRWL